MNQWKMREWLVYILYYVNTHTHMYTITLRNRAVLCDGMVFWVDVPSKPGAWFRLFSSSPTEYHLSGCTLKHPLCQVLWPASTFRLCSASWAPDPWTTSANGVWIRSLLSLSVSYLGGHCSCPHRERWRKTIQTQECALQEFTPCGEK